MKSNRILLKIGFLISLIFTFMIINVTINLRDFALINVKDKANLIADSVRSGITSHMVNGTMENKQFYLNEIKNLNNINHIEIIRSDFIEKEFGSKNSSHITKEEKEVLNSGKTSFKIEEELLGKSTYKITIPYIAEKNDRINCVQCHNNAQIGDVLGAITMDIDVSETKLESTKIIATISLVSFFLIILIISLTNKMMSPYILAFKKIKENMEFANKGIYTNRLELGKHKETNEVYQWVNSMFDKFQNSLDEIEFKIGVFLSAHKIKKNKDPILDVKDSVNELVELYNFRKIIENDSTIEEIYERLAYVIKDKFNILDFNFIESDTTSNKRNIIYISNEIHCDPIKNECRADRTNNIQDSCKFKNLCKHFNNENKKYICIPFSISNDLNLIISIIGNNEEEMINIRSNIPLIKDYINTAKAELVSKKLMQKLEMLAQTDPLTGLYNRKYLDRYIENTLYVNSKGKPAGIMMVDIDYFKQINDNYGHDIGDIAIKTIANTLRDCVDNNDKIIRFGGEEFVVVLNDTNMKDLIKKAEEIRIAFSRQKIQAGVETFSKTVSIGVSLFTNETKNFWKYVKQADIALYHAKETGRNKVVQYTNELEEK